MQDQTKNIHTHTKKNKTKIKHRLHIRERLKWKEKKKKNENRQTNKPKRKQQFRFKRKTDEKGGRCYRQKNKWVVDAEVRQQTDYRINEQNKNDLLNKSPAQTRAGLVMLNDALQPCFEEGTGKELGRVRPLTSCHRC